jgi:pseudouridine synthase
MVERIQKIMSRAGVGSRRESEQLIRAGRVRLNGRVVRLGDKGDLESDLIEVDGQQLKIERRIYIKLYKPKGVISSTEDELRSGRTTVRDLINLPGFLYPVGRLDKQSEGLMILTNDGELTHRLTHPRYQHRKVYSVLLEGDVSEDSLDLWRRGLDLDGRITAPAEIGVEERNGVNTLLRVVLREGRKRQIRRVAASLGHPVLRLIRFGIGPITLGELSEGEWSHLADAELVALREAVQLN